MRKEKEKLTQDPDPAEERSVPQSTLELLAGRLPPSLHGLVFVHFDLDNSVLSLLRSGQDCADLLKSFIYFNILI